VARQRRHEFGKAARILDPKANPVRRLTIDLGGFGSEPVPMPASVSDSARSGRCNPTCSDE
jgi:hypothetical protein